jgi:maltoporin
LTLRSPACYSRRVRHPAALLLVLQCLGVSPASADREGFEFGSYGRVGISSDLDGSKGKPHNVVSHGTRLEEPLYAELDFRYAHTFGEMRVRIHTTLGFLDDFFHFTGQFRSTMAIRNLYAEAEHVLTEHLSLWAGSRMYRGDDIYLFDFWPLDNLNTLGGGFGLRFGTTELKIHVGASRLEDPYQLQIVTIPRSDFGTDELVFQDRQKNILSLKLVHEWPELTSGMGMKAILYGELHYLPGGQLQKNNFVVEPLPSDWGGVIGAQLGFWERNGKSFANLFLRTASGLAAYGDLSVPFGLGPDKRATGARELLIGLSANYDAERLGVMMGSYLRYFRDADPNLYQRADGWEFIAAVRPHLYLNRYFQQLFEVSYQERRPNGLSPNTNTFLHPRAFQFAIMPTISVDRGTYTRPQFRFVYAVSALNDGARDLFPLGDVRRGQSIQHLVGFMAEWWFQSSYRYAQ